MNDDKRLLPCPFCGNVSIKEENDAWPSIGQPPRQWWVECWGGCYARTAKFGSEAEALAAWNTRVGPAARANGRKGGRPPLHSA